MHGLDEYDSEARWYYPAIMRTTTIDPLAEKFYDISPYAWCENNPIVLIDPDGRSPRLAKMAIKTVVKSVAKGKLDLGDVYDLVDAGKTLLDPNSSMLDKGLAVFDILSPVSSKEIKAGAKMLGVVDGANDAKKAANKVNKNANSAEGNFVLYEVKDANGNTLKVGKADADRVNSEGVPVRVSASERSAQKTNPGATAEVVPGSHRNTTTGQMKEYEAKTVRDHRANGKELPLNRERDKRYRNNN